MADSLPPEEIPPYRCLHRLGAGGMGEVWLGLDTRSGERVALKIARSLPGDQGTSRMRREAELLSRLRSPWLPRFRSLVETGERLVLVMDFVDGTSVEAALRTTEGPADRRDLLASVAPALAGGLADLHGAGILHRDVKPQNLMVGREGGAVLVDLGLARAAGVATLTRTGSAVGTPEYLPPEMIRNEAVGPRADLYQAALVVLRILQGPRSISPGAAFDEALRRSRQRPEDPRKELPWLDPELARWIEDCLHPDPGLRPEPGAALARLPGLARDALQAAARGRDATVATTRDGAEIEPPPGSRPVSSRPGGAEGQGLQVVRRDRSPAIPDPGTRVGQVTRGPMPLLAAVAIAFVLGCFVGNGLGSRGSPDGRQPAIGDSLEGPLVPKLGPGRRGPILGLSRRDGRPFVAEVPTVSGYVSAGPGTLVTLPLNLLDVPDPRRLEVRLRSETREFQETAEFDLDAMVRKALEAEEIPESSIEELSATLRAGSFAMRADSAPLPPAVSDFFLERGGTLSGYLSLAWLDEDVRESWYQRLWPLRSLEWAWRVPARVADGRIGASLGHLLTMADHPILPPPGLGERLWVREAASVGALGPEGTLAGLATGSSSRSAEGTIRIRFPSPSRTRVAAAELGLYVSGGSRRSGLVVHLPSARRLHLPVEREAAWIWHRMPPAWLESGSEVEIELSLDRSPGMDAPSKVLIGLAILRALVESGSTGRLQVEPVVQDG